MDTEFTGNVVCGRFNAHLSAPCGMVSMESNPPLSGTIQPESSSQDEVALVKGMMGNNCFLVERTSSQMKIRLNGAVLGKPLPRIWRVNEWKACNVDMCYVPRMVALFLWEVTPQPILPNVIILLYHHFITSSSEFVVS